MIQFSQVSKAFGRQQVLVDVTFTVHPGERVGIVGPNGAGKSTMFEILSGAQTPDKGEVSYPSSMRLAYVHQQLHDVASETPLLDYAENALPELQHLQEELEKLRGLSRLARKFSPAALMLMHAGKFKDEARCYACLQAAFRETDVVMRMGGDEFIVYAINMADINHVENKLRDLIRSVHMVITDEEKHEFITVSIGCIINLGSYPNYEALSSAADKLLYSVKGSGKDSFLCSDMDYAGG